MKKKTIQEQLNEYRASVVEELEIWKRHNERGCTDPFWADGCNMNLIRNHIIYYKDKITKICEESRLTLPEEYYLPLPPEIDNGYMARLDQEERVQRLMQSGQKLTTKKVKYDEMQLSLF